MQGANFGHGFFAAGAAQAFAPGIDLLDSSSSFSPVRIFTAALVAGTSSKLTGGKFSNGAVTGGFSRMFNDDLHDQLQTEENYEAGYPFGEESQMALSTTMSEEELTLYDEVWKQVIRNRIMGKTAEQHAADNYLLDNPGSIVIVGGITLRVGLNNAIRYPDLTAFKKDGSIEFIEVKAGAAMLSPRQIKLDRIIQTHGATISRSVTGYLPAGTVLGPTNVDLHRITFGNLGLNN